MTAAPPRPSGDEGDRPGDVEDLSEYLGAPEPRAADGGEAEDEDEEQEQPGTAGPEADEADEPEADAAGEEGADEAGASTAAAGCEGRGLEERAGGRTHLRV